MSIGEPGDAPVILGDGLTMRAATAADVEAIVELEVDAFGASDEPGVRGHLGAVGNWTVVVDGDRVVAASGLLAHRMILDGCRFPAGQVEYVATDPGYQRRGLVRAQFGWHHRRAAARGDLALFITGIPYLYRRFGYGYGLDYPPFLLPRGPDPAEDHPSTAGDLTFRTARPGDHPAIRRLDALRPPTGLRVERDDTSWATITTICAPDTFEHLTVAEHGGQIVGWMRTQDKPEDDRVYLAAAAVDPDGPEATAASLVAHAREAAGDRVLVVFDQPDTPFATQLATATDLGGHARHDHGIYVRVPDPVALLTALRPTLSSRLAASRYAERGGELGGELVISLYERSVTLDLGVGGRAGDIVGVRDTPGIEDPFHDGGVGVAPDWFGALVFGRWGAIGLEQRADDVTLGRSRGLMEALFPAVPTDVVGDF
jgi:predicted N-acetyltransferase YhbS